MSFLRGVGLRLPGSILAGAAARPRTTGLISAVSRRLSQTDCTREMIGEREIVGHGINGCPVYVDTVDCPFPAIRFREVTSEVCALRQKEQEDWKKLTVQDKKTLYRHSFCQTYAEFQYFSPDWKLCVGIGLWTIAVAVFITLLYNFALYPKLPETFEEDRRQAQLRRMIQLQMNPVTGLASKWNYNTNKWK